MRRWLVLSHYNAVTLIAFMCGFSLGLAFLSYNLFALAMANLGFLQKHGLMAVAEGGLVQLMQIGLKGLLALLFYLGFKGVEAELIARWRNRPDD